MPALIPYHSIPPYAPRFMRGVSGKRADNPPYLSFTNRHPQPAEGWGEDPRRSRSDITHHH